MVVKRELEAKTGRRPGRCTRLCAEDGAAAAAEPTSGEAERPSLAGRQGVSGQQHDGIEYFRVDDAAILEGGAHRLTADIGAKASSAVVDTPSLTFNVPGCSRCNPNINI